jgi:hypothetical protein
MMNYITERNCLDISDRFSLYFIPIWVEVTIMRMVTLREGDVRLRSAPFVNSGQYQISTLVRSSLPGRGGNYGRRKI